MAEINMEISPASVISTAVDATLSISGEAADAKAVGDALAQKADRSELAIKLSVNGQEADGSGAVLITGTNIPVSDADQTSIAEKVEALDRKTGIDMPLSESDGRSLTETILDFSDAVENASSVAAQADNKAVEARVLAQNALSQSGGNLNGELYMHGNIHFQPGDQTRGAYFHGKVGDFASHLVAPDNMSDVPGTQEIYLPKKSGNLALSEDTSPIGGNGFTLASGLNAVAGATITLNESVDHFKYLIFQTGNGLLFRPAWRGGYAAYGIRIGGNSNENLMTILMVINVLSETQIRIDHISFNWSNTTTIDHNTGNLTLNAVYGIR